MAFERRKNRRKGPDALVKAINYLAAFSWVIIFVVIIVFSLAKPRIQGIKPGHSVVSTGAWDSSLLEISLYLMVLQVIFAIAGLLINSNRMKRKGDQYNTSLIVSGSLAVFGLMIYAVFL